jgi:hypothetical protein
MSSKKPKLLMNGHTDEIYTPAYALNPLIPYLNKSWVVWECAYGKGALAKHLQIKGFKVVGKGEDFFKENKECDCIITNPPYSLKGQFIKRAFELKKPFAFLLPLTTLEGKYRGDIFRNNKIQLIIPNRRINFITPNGGKSSWFATAWFCGNMNLEKDLNFVELTVEK